MFCDKIDNPGSKEVVKIRPARKRVFSLSPRIFFNYVLNQACGIILTTTAQVYKKRSVSKYAKIKARGVPIRFCVCILFFFFFSKRNFENTL